MKTALASDFQPVLDREDGEYRLYPPASSASSGRFSSYEHLRRIIRDSPVNKLNATVEDADSLWRFTRIGAILSDVTLLSGTAPVGSMGIGDYICTKVSTDAFTRRLLWFFDWEAIQQWAEEAAPFILDGRVIFLPKRGIARSIVKDLNARVRLVVEEGDDEPEPEPIDTPSEDTLVDLSATMPCVDLEDNDYWTVTDEHFEFLSNRSTALQSLSPQTDATATLFEIALPFIANTSLQDLHKFLQDEEDTLAAFRSSLVTVFNEHVGKLSAEESPDNVRRAGLSIRRDVIEPQLAALTRSLKRLVQTRAIRLAGATIGTVGLALTASAVQPLSAIMQTALGGSGLGLLAREYAEYRADLLALRDSPWYFAWALRNKQRA